MFETVVIATDGSTSAERAVNVALDVAGRFDATVETAAPSGVGIETAVREGDPAAFPTDPERDRPVID